MITPLQGFDDDWTENPGLRPGLSDDALAGLEVGVKFANRVVGGVGSGVSRGLDTPYARCRMTPLQG
jgi:hypothetical protein